MKKKLNIFSDVRGKLVSIESNTDIPFEIKRIFYMYDLKKSKKRGSHAHFNTQQCIFALSGSCEISLESIKGNKEKFILNDPGAYIFKDKLVWIEISGCSDDCVLMVMCNTKYDQNDYIKNYKKFKEISLENKYQ